MTELARLCTLWGPRLCGTTVARADAMDGAWYGRGGPESARA
jgi:hypothetical protein